MSEKLNVVKNSINIIQITSPIPTDPLHPTDNARKREAQAECLGLIKMALRHCIKDINSMDTVQMRRVYGELMNEVSSKAQYISSEYNMQIDSLYFEWDKFIPTLERQFTDILKCLVMIIKANITPRNRELNINFRSRVNNRPQKLTPPCPRITQPSIRGKFHHGKNSSYTTSEMTFNHHQCTQFTNHTYHTT